MHSYSALSSFLLSLLLLSKSVLSQNVADDLSFGHKTPISPDGAQIPGWHIMFDTGHQPKILSDRVTLTPPSPGHVRLGMWTHNHITTNEWSFDLDFRATGPERGGGNMQLWYAADPSPAAFLNSIYTVEKFEGLAIVIDQYGGSGGSIRAFLNDGTMNYKNHHNPDSLAFANCNYSYRNRGALSALNVKHSAAGLEVYIDKELCFKTDLVSLPDAWHFAISAASADIPDSFEVHKFAVSPGGSGSSHASTNYDASTQQHVVPQNEQMRRSSSPSDNGEVLERLNGLSTTLNNIYAQFSILEGHMDSRQTELKEKLPSAVGGGVNTAQIDAIDRRIQAIEQTVLRIQRDIEGRDYKDTLAALQVALRQTQSELMSGLPQTMTNIMSSSAPRIGFFVFVILGFQVALAGSYVLYKRRRANSPKKLL